jgi:hypothetical protein
MAAKYLNISDVPLALRPFLAKDHYDYNEDPDTISATTLLKPIRQIVLTPRVPPGDGLISLPDMLSSRMGTAIHTSIEDSWTKDLAQSLDYLGTPKSVVEKIIVNPLKEDLKPDSIPIYLEQRLSKKLGKWTITGKFDFIGEGMVQDFKTTSVWTYRNQSNNEKYTQQGSIYRWLDPELITNSHMQVNYIFMDWSSAMQKRDPKYPPNRIMAQTFPLMSITETEQFIKSKLSLIEQYMNAKEEDIPRCTDAELWRSDPVYKYYKNKQNTTKSTKNFDNQSDAYQRLAEDNNIGMVITVPGEVKACKYCPAFAVCSQKDDLIASGDLSFG